MINKALSQSENDEVLRSACKLNRRPAMAGAVLLRDIFVLGRDTHAMVDGNLAMSIRAPCSTPSWKSVAKLGGSLTIAWLS